MHIHTHTDRIMLMSTIMTYTYRTDNFTPC